MKCILDIETAPLPDAADWLPEVEPPANYRDPAKIEAWIAEARAEQLAKAALDPDLCRVVALGLLAQGTDTPAVLLAASDAMERELLAALSSVGEAIGFGVLRFDLPILQRRAWYLGVTLPPFNLDRYRSPHIDLEDLLSVRGRYLLKGKSLDFYCKRFGISDHGDTTKGKDIPALVAENTPEAWDKVETHCRADVLKTRDLARRLGVW
jgi:hypothetical protein